MWAEIMIKCKKDLPQNLEEIFGKEFMAPSEDKKRVIDSTITWNGNYSFLNHICYAQLSNTRVFFIICESSSIMKIQIESNVDKSDIRALNKVVEELILQIITFLKKNHNGIIEVKALLYAEGGWLQTCEYVPFWRRIFMTLQNNKLLDLIIPLFTAISSVIIKFDVFKAILNAIIVITATFIFLCIKIYFEKEFSYSAEV